MPVNDGLFPLEPVAVDKPPRGQRRRPERPAANRRGTDRQVSLFSAELVDPSPDDLAGLLAGPGQVVRMGGTARVSVVVEDEWRAAALLAAFTERGLTGNRVPSADEHIGVRTAFSAVLAPLAAGWLRGASMQPPPGFALTGQQLRLWAVAAGRRESDDYVLSLSVVDESTWLEIGRALRAAGFPAELVGPRAGGPGYRISGRRRLAVLADLLGVPPPGALPDGWPADVGVGQR
jgi:hypothetical protein